MAASTNSSAPATVVNQLSHQVYAFFLRPVDIIRHYHRDDLRPDVIAGLTVAVVTLPQAIVYALIAELPPHVGLYAAIVAAIVGALWGSSFHMHTGPTNATSLLILGTLLTIAAPGSPEFLAAAGLMAVMVGVLRLVMGLARLGFLVNFVSDSVVIGFTAGAGVLISINQIRHLLRLPIPGTSQSVEMILDVFHYLPETHGPSLTLGVATIVLIAVARKLRPMWPNALIGMVVASMAIVALNLDHDGVVVLGELPRGLPPLAALPLLDLTLIRQLSTAALAVAALGLVEAISIARTVAAQSGQHIDSNQEFVGQGLANIAAGLFSGYACSGSFTRSALNYASGARTPLASVFSSLWLLLAVLLFAPLAVYLPRPALAAVLIVTAYSMVDRREMVRIWHTSKGDSAIMIATLLATLLLPLEFAVLAGVLVSFGRYIAKTSAPSVHSMLPDERFQHLTYQPERPVCPQLGVLTIEGSLYFGACHHVEEMIRSHMEEHPGQKFMLLRMHRVNFCDISGLHMLETVVRLYRQRGGDVFMVGVRNDVWQKMQLSDFDHLLGIDHFLSQERAIEHIFYKILDPAYCIYKCQVKVWKECQSLPKSYTHNGIPLGTLVPVTAVIPNLTPQQLWQQLNDGQKRPLVIDVREPAEFEGGHVPHAQLIPMPNLLAGKARLPRDQNVILVCRTGRRTTQVIYALQQAGYHNLSHLAGGMVAWDTAGLPAIIE